MKTISLLLCILAIPVLLNAQDKGKDVVIGATNMNILYRGVTNPVEIAVSGSPSDKVTATVSDGTIMKTDKSWLVTPGSQDELTITVLVSGKIVSDRKFRIKNIPQPVAQFAGKSEGSISKETAMNTLQVTADLISFDWDMSFRVVSFRFVYHKAGYVNELASTSDKITDQMRNVIKDFTSGDKFGFEDIRAVGPDGKIKMMNSISLAIE
jgi:hypothetical protein